MNRYLTSGDPSHCCGCRACEQACPTKAITILPNEEGFLYPVVEQSRCVDCGLCGKVCPVEHRPEGREIAAVYGVQHRDEAILKGSSSGGVFRLLADHVIGEGGCVVGCKWGDGNRPVLAVAESVQELLPMQGSKYLSSDTNTVYSQVKQRLEAGQRVLFTGAPCQCAGLLNYLRKPYENLITADFLCHGMPSQQIFDAYIDDLENRLGTKVYDIHFRDKSVRGWGMAFSYRYQKGGREKKICNVGWTDPYLHGFIQGYFYRYSCYECPFRGGSRFTDLTFCDYWGVEKKHPSLPSHKGVSAVSVNSQKGAALWGALAEQAHWIATEKSYVAADNPSLTEDAKETIPPIRQQIYGMVRRDGWRRVARKHLRVKFRPIKKLWYRIPRGLSVKIKGVLRR